MFNKNKSMMETDKSKLDNGMIKDFFIILLIYFAGTILSGFLMGVLTPFFINIKDTDLLLEGNNFEVIMKENIDTFLIISLFLTLISTFVLYILARNYYKRSKESLGLKGEHRLRDYLIGAALGIVSIGVIALILQLSGNIEFTLSIENISISIFILYIIGWIFQGFNEEFLCRSILMNYYASKKSITFAFIINSAIFSLLHLLNDGFSILPSINIFLVGLIFSLSFYAFDNILMASGFHSFWNMAQANIFGISVSGIMRTENTIFSSKNIGSDLLNGGEFGIEGGLVTTFVLIVLLIVLYSYAKKKSETFAYLGEEENVY